MTRREFLALVGAATAAVRPSGVSANPLGLPFGFQAWEIAPDMRKDWDGQAFANRFDQTVADSLTLGGLTRRIDQ